MKVSAVSDPQIERRTGKPTDLVVDELADHLNGIAQVLEKLDGRSVSNSGVESREVLELLEHHAERLAFCSDVSGYPGIVAISQNLVQSCQVLLACSRSLTSTDISELRIAYEALCAELNIQAAVHPVDSVEPEPARYYSDRFDILVVSDDDQICRQVMDLCEREGMFGGVARSGEMAMGMMEQRLPDGIIVDVAVSGEQGYELVDRIRQLPQGSGPAIVMVSTQKGFLDKVEAIRCGADGYFERPVHWEAFMRRLKNLLERAKPVTARVMIVEDDHDQAMFVQRILESVGYEPLICSHPLFFEFVLTAFQPHLILMDVKLPGATGYDLVRFLRQNERYATLPVMFMTADAGQRNTGRLESVRAGGDDFLVKPIDPELLLSLIAARLERARLLKEQVMCDGLTLLLNHTAFMERTRSIVCGKHRYPGKTAAMILLDVDQFRKINERFSYIVGDRLLVSLAGMLRQRLRQSDVIGRYGGDEFAVIVTDLSQHDAERLIVRLLEEFSSVEHQTPDGTVFRATFSAGVAMLEMAMPGLKEWIQEAGQALQVAKAAGPGQIRFAADTRIFFEDPLDLAC